MNSIRQYGWKDWISNPQNKSLYEKDMAKGRIISTIKSDDPDALTKYAEAMREWDEVNRPKYIPSISYLDEFLGNLPQELKVE